MKQESIRMLQDNLDNLVVKHNILIKDNKFGEALNVMKNIDAITYQLKRLGVLFITDTNENTIELYVEKGRPITD